MRGKQQILGATLFLSATLLSGCSGLGAQRPLLEQIEKRDQFHVVDILMYRDKPDVAEIGLMPGLGTAAFFAPGHHRRDLDEGTFRTEIAKWKDFPGLFYIELELWPVCNVPDSVAEATIARLSRAVDITREVAPRLTFGIYAMMPAPIYGPLVYGDTAGIGEWKRCNRRMAILANKVDVIFPSLYTFDQNEKEWEKFAIGVLREARQYGKPVYAFLWPEYHESNKKLAGVHIPGPVWRRELELVKREADGVVLWNGWKRPWSESADWWRETRAFMRTLQATAPRR